MRRGCIGSASGKTKEESRGGARGGKDGEERGRRKPEDKPKGEQDADISSLTEDQLKASLAKARLSLINTKRSLDSVKACTRARTGTFAARIPVM